MATNWYEMREIFIFKLFTRLSFGVGTRNLFNFKKFYFSYEKNLQKNTKTGFLSNFSFHISLLC